MGVMNTSVQSGRLLHFLSYCKRWNNWPFVQAVVVSPFAPIGCGFLARQKSFLSIHDHWNNLLFSCFVLIFCVFNSCLNLVSVKKEHLRAVYHVFLFLSPKMMFYQIQHDYGGTRVEQGRMRLLVGQSGTNQKADKVWIEDLYLLLFKPS